MIKCLAIDDEPLALRQLASYIDKIPFLELSGTCESAFDARNIMEEEMIDAIFIDINMPDLNGMEFVKSLAAPPLIIFTTAYSEYAIDSYKVDAVDYLLKPFGLDDLRRAANKLKTRYEMMRAKESAIFSQPSDSGDDDTTLFLKTEHRVVRIDIKDIRYIEGMSEYLRIHFEAPTRPLTVLLSMKKIEERLPSEQFMRIHRSYIINLRKIQEVNKNRVIMDKETYLPIGDLYREALNTYINSKFLGK